MSVFDDEVRRQALSHPAIGDVIVLGIRRTDHSECVLMFQVLRMVPCPPETPNTKGFEFWGVYDRALLVWNGHQTECCYITWGYQCQRCQQTFFRERGANIAAFGHDCLGDKVEF